MTFSRHIRALKDSGKCVCYLLFAFLNLAVRQLASAQTPKSPAFYFAPSRTYVYEVAYYNTAGKLLSLETLTLQPSGQTWTIDPKQTLLTFLIDNRNTDTLVVGSSLPNGKKLRLYKEFQEGVIESPGKVWMHPLRQNQYCLTEVAPFPEVQLPPQTGKSWSSQLSIYSGWQAFEGNVNSQYEITGRQMRNYTMGNLACWQIKAVAEHTKLGKSEALFFFNTEIGFTEMNYTFYNGFTLTIKIINFKQA